MNGDFEVLSPWAEIDSVPFRGISPRLNDLAGKKIGLFINQKRSAPLMMDVVERSLGAKYPDIEFSRFKFPWNNEITGSPFESKLKEWLKGVDAVIASVGD